MGPAHMLPHDRYLLHGPDDLGDAELISLILGTGTRHPTTRGLTTRAIAAEVLDRFGSARAAAASPVRALAEIPGVGPTRAVRLHAGLSLGMRASQLTPESASPVRTPAEAAAWLRPALAMVDHEEVHALYLDGAFRPRALRRLSRGTATFSPVDQRQVFGPAMALGAHGVILAHNHPSGALEPSSSDRALTDRLERAAQTLGIQFVDHLIVASSGWRSISMHTSYRW